MGAKAMKNIVRCFVVAGLLIGCCQPSQAAVTLVKALMSTSPNDQNCNPGPTVTTFPNTTADAWLYFEVSGAAVGDQVHVDFLAPNGTLYLTDTFDPLTISGTVCFSASLHITGTTAANQPGTWTARAVYNGSPITTQTFSITGQGSNCVFAVNPLTVQAPAAAGTGQISVSTVAGCSWSATSGSSFITITSGASGTGNGTVNYSVAANNTTGSRTGTLTVAGQTVTITQAAPVSCAYAINPLSASISNAGGTGSIAVSTTSGCQWTAVSNASFITVTSGASGTGSGTVNYSVAANTGAARSGTLTVAGQTFTVNQTTSTISLGQPFFVDGRANVWDAGRTTPSSGILPPSYRFTPGAGKVITFSNVTGTAECSGPGSVCPTMSGPDGAPGGFSGGALGPTQGLSGIIDRSFGFSMVGVFLDDNAPSNPPESLDFTVATFTKINPKIGQVFWIGDGFSGTGAGTVQQFIVPPTATRIFIGLADGIGVACCYDDNLGGFNVTMNMSSGGVPCTYSLSPNPITVGSAGGPQTVTINTQPGCFWSSTVNDSFLTVNPNASNNGTGTMPFNVAALSGSASRTGTILIADQTLTVNQSPSANCSFAVNPLTATVPAGGGNGTVAVTATASTCSWTATANANFLSIISGATGTGNGTVSYTATANTGTTSRTGTLTVAGQTVTITQPGTPACSYAINPPSASVTAAGGTGSVAVSTGSTCTWTAVSNAAFLTVTSGASGTGNGTVNYSVAANSGAAARSGTITVAGQSFTVNQAAASTDCLFGLSPNSQNVGAPGGSFTVRVSAPAGCTYSAVSNSDFLTITSGASGNGDGTVSYTVAAYSGTQPRTGTLTIAGATFTVTQTGTAPCTFSIDKTSATAPAAGNSGTVQVTASSGTCSWSATPGVPWITITSGATGAGNGAVNYTVAANTGAARSGTITIAGQTFTVNQDAGSNTGSCTYTLSVLGTVITSSTPLPSVPAAGGDITVQVQASAATCTWTASSAASFITIKSGSPGTGNGSVVLTAAANTGAVRSGSVTIAGQTFTVTQDAGSGGGSCSYTFTPPTGNAPAAGGDLSVQVTASAGTCTWTATTTASFITIKSGSPGTGNGTINYTVAANAGPARTGTITLSGPAGQATYTVNQGTTQITLGQPFFVDGRANLWAAGRATASSGLLPPSYRFTPGAGQVLTFSNVNGTAECSSPGSVCPNMTGPDGVPIPDQSGGGLSAVQGLSGILSRSAGYFMVGVFLDDNAPDGTPPEALDFTNAGFTKIDPKIGQVFFIGDGQGSGGQQQFFIPPTATRVFLGLADGVGSPCCYDDNLGGFNVTLNIAAGGPACSYTLNPSTVIAPPGGGPLSTTVNTQPGCFWSSTVKDSWIKVNPNASSNGTGTFSFTVDPVGGSARTGTVLLADQTLTVTQKQAVTCSYTLSPTSNSAAGTGGAGSFAITPNDSSCTWSATVDQAWITITSGSSGTGNGTINYTVAANSGTARTGTIHAGGQVFTINEAAAPAVNCTFTLSPTSGTQPAGGGTGNFRINPSAPSCTWTAASNANWLTVTAGSSGTGPGTISYSATANTGAARTGTITAGGQTFTVSQDAPPPVPCTYTLTPQSATALQAGNTGSVAVATTSTCQWTATSNATWITVSGTGSGTGNGNFSYAVAANTGTARTGTISVSGQTFTVTQDAGSTTACTYLSSTLGS